MSAPFISAIVLAAEAIRTKNYYIHRPIAAGVPVRAFKKSLSGAQG
jgi:hypothetical protein